MNYIESIIQEAKKANWFRVKQLADEAINATIKRGENFNFKPQCINIIRGQNYHHGIIEYFQNMGYYVVDAPFYEQIRNIIGNSELDEALKCFDTGIFIC